MAQEAQDLVSVEQYMLDMTNRFNKLQVEFEQTKSQMAEMIAEGVSSMIEDNRELLESVVEALANRVLEDVGAEDDNAGSDSTPVWFRWRNDTASGDAEGIHRLEYLYGDRKQPGGADWPDTAWTAVEGADGVPCGS